MRLVYLATATALLGVGGTAMTACRDDAPTAVGAADRAASSIASRSAHSPSVTTPLQLPAEGFTSEIVSRGRFFDNLDVQFRIKNERATTVVHVTEPSDMVMARITIPPNRSLPWHSHPGPAMVTVASGTLVLIDESCTSRTLDATDPAKPKPAFVDRGQGHVHVAYNPGTTPTVVTVTYLGVTGPSALIRTGNPGC